VRIDPIVSDRIQLLTKHLPWSQAAESTLALLDGRRGWPFVMERFEESSQGLCAVLVKLKLLPETKQGADIF